VSEAAQTTTDHHTYPAMFRAYVARGLRMVLDNLDAEMERLDDAQRERGLHLLSYGMRLDDAWDDTRDLTLALAPHLERQGYRHAWIEMLGQALKQAVTQGDDCGAAQICLRLGRLHILLGDYATADAYLMQMRQLAVAVGDQRTQAVALERLGHCAFERSDLVAASAYAEASLALVPLDDTVAASNWHLLGMVALREGNVEKSIEDLQRALAINRNYGRRQGVMIALRELGVAYWHGKHFDLAVSVLAETVELSIELGDRFGEALARMNLGIAYWYQGEYTQALAAYSPCETVFRQIAGRSYLARLYNNQGLAYRELNEVERARECFDSSLELALCEQDYLEAANVLDSLAGLRLRMGDAAGAISAWQMALTELAHLPEPPRYLHNLIHERMKIAQPIAQAGGFPAPESHPLDITA